MKCQSLALDPVHAFAAALERAYAPACLRTLAERKPRTLCRCQPVRFWISRTVSLSGRQSRAYTWAALAPSRKRTLAFSPFPSALARARSAPRDPTTQSKPHDLATTEQCLCRGFRDRRLCCKLAQGDAEQALLESADHALSAKMCLTKRTC